ncbi:MAG TPA: molybdate ABC transporter permease subunit [Rhizobiales bacterium]|nr:molybdate ABC transporter permease subunit [Hyphomicrobiales bacterium]
MSASPEMAAIWLTLKLAGLSMLILMLLGAPLAWWLSRTNWRGKVVLEAIIALPLVLPPTVLGFYLLLALGPGGFIGGALEALGAHHLAFSFTGLVIGSVFYSLPFAVQPLQGAFQAIGARPLEAAATMGAGPLDRFFTVALPLARRGVITAASLSFAHTLGEFGVVLMIGGNIPGKTQTLSILIYDQTEAMRFGAAHMLSAGLLGFAFVLLLGIYALNRRFPVGLK